VHIWGWVEENEQGFFSERRKKGYAQPSVSFRSHVLHTALSAPLASSSPDPV